MTDGAAIKAGSAYIEFWGDLSKINKVMDDISRRGASWASRFTAPKDAADAVTAAVQQSSAAAEQFAARATAANSQASATFAGTSAAANQAAVSMTGVGATATSFGSLANAAITPQVANFIKLGLTALSAGANLSRMLYPLGKLSGLVGYVMVAVNNVARLGKAAGIASTILHHVSSEIRAAGMSTVYLDKIEAALTRIGARARYLSIITRVAFAPYRAAWALTGMAGRGIYSLGSMAFGAGAGALRGMRQPGGAMQAASMIGMGALSAGHGSGAAGGAMLGGFAMGGFSGAAIVGVAIMASNAFKKAWNAEMKQGGDSDGGFLEVLVYKARQYGQWVSETWTSVTDRLSAMFKGPAVEGQSMFERIERAMYPIVYAVENVFIPTFLTAIETIKGVFGSGASEMSRTWTDWIFESIGSVANFVGNFDLYFQLAQQYVVLFAANAINSIGDFFNNIGGWLKWMGQNWYSVLVDIGNYHMVAFGNIFKNLKDNYAELWKAIRSGGREGLDFKWTKLGDGFKATASDMPKILKSEWAKSMPEIDAIWKKIEERQKKAEVAFSPMDMLNPNLKTKLTSTSTLNSFAAARLGGTVESPLNKVAKHTEETAKNTKKLADRPNLVFGK